MKSVEVPRLAHDAMMKSVYGKEVSTRGILERRIVANLIAHMKERGWIASGVWDGASVEPATDMKDAMELIFNLDDSWLHFVDGDGRHHSVYLVLGNGIDLVSDYSFAEGDVDGFAAAIEAFNAEDFA